MDSFDPISALVGGTATSIIGNYLGIQSPILYPLLKEILYRMV